MATDSEATKEGDFPATLHGAGPSPQASESQAAAVDLLAAHPDVILEVDAEGTLQRQHGRRTSQFFVGNGPILGRGLQEFLPHAVSAACLDILAQALAQPQEVITLEVAQSTAAQAGLVCIVRALLQQEGRPRALMVLREVPLSLQDHATAHLQWREMQCILDASASGSCVLDREGRILRTNAAWRRFSIENGGDCSKTGVGQSYLSAIQLDYPEDGDTALQAFDCIRSVLSGECDQKQWEYPCHAPSRERWFIGRVSRIDGPGPQRALVEHIDITERKALERRLLDAQEQAQLGNWELDLASDRLWWSEGLYRIFGIPPGALEPSYEGFLRLVHVDDVETVRNAYEQSLRDGSSYCIVHRIRHHLDGIRYVEERGETTYCTATGRPLRSRGTTQDVTERVEAQRELQLSQQRLTLALEASKQGLWDWDVGTDSVFVSDSFWGMLGYSERNKPPSRQVFSTVVHPDDQALVVSLLSRFRAPESDGWAAEIRCLTAEGDVRWMRVAGRVVAVHASGWPVRVTGVAVDISKDRESREALRRSEAHLRLAMEASGAASWTYNVALGRTTYGPDYVRLLGHAPPQSDRGSAPLQGLVHPADQAGAKSAFLSTLVEGAEQYSAVFRVRPLDGDWKWVQASGRVSTRGPDGAPVEIIGTHMDIDLLKAHEQRLMEMVAEKELLLREVTHRVKNNIQMLSGLLNYRARHYDHPAVGEAFASVQERMLAMRLVHERLYQSGKVSTLPLCPYIASLGAELATLGSGAELDLVVDVDDCEIALEVDAVTSIGMIVTELVTNAYKHAFPDGRNGRTTLSLPE